MNVIFLPHPAPPSPHQAVGELWAFSLADTHILTRKSGFGKVGAMVSAGGGGPQRHIFTIDFPMQVQCGLAEGCMLCQMCGWMSACCAKTLQACPDECPACCLLAVFSSQL